MAKKSLPRVIETLGLCSGEVHAEGTGIAGNATLCGMSDIGGAAEYGTKKTEASITCAACLEIIQHVHAHAKP